jgi:hypothetical protein
MKEKIKLWLVTMLLSKMDPITVEDIYKKRIKIALFELYRNNLSPQTTDREVAAMIFDAKYTEVLIDLGFRTLSGEDPKPSELLSGYYQKANKGDISFMKGDFYRHLVQVGDNEVRKLRYRIKRNQ